MNKCVKCNNTKETELYEKNKAYAFQHSVY